jgi:hypothetical protein
MSRWSVWASDACLCYSQQTGWLAIQRRNSVVGPGFETRPGLGYLDVLLWFWSDPLEIVEYVDKGTRNGTQINPLKTERIRFI